MHTVQEEVMEVYTVQEGVLEEHRVKEYVLEVHTVKKKVLEEQVQPPTWQQGSQELRFSLFSSLSSALCSLQAWMTASSSARTRRTFTRCYYNDFTN